MVGWFSVCCIIAMGKRWSGLLLLVLVLLAASIHCSQSLQESHESHESQDNDAVLSSEVDDDDDLEDLEDGMDDVDSAAAAAAEFASGAADAMAASKVANVNDHDVERVIAKVEYLLLVGYAPWDTQSQVLLPEFAAAAVRLAKLGNPTVLAKLDAVNNPSAAAICDIQGFPTLAFFVNGSRMPYTGGFSRYLALNYPSTLTLALLPYLSLCKTQNPSAAIATTPPIHFQACTGIRIPATSRSGSRKSRQLQWHWTTPTYYHLAFH